MKPNQKIQSFKEFWPYYLGEHRDPRTRRLHFVGTTLAILSVATAVASRQPWLLAVAFVVGYGPAWISHYFIENNRPATFTYPFWSLAADFKLWWLMLIRDKSVD